jgi:hypothetical protein
VAKTLQSRRSKAMAPRAWQRMLSGRRLDLLDPSPLDIEIEDIAHGLARVARWNGQTTGDHAFSVAQHSVVVEEIAAHIRPRLEPRWRLAALLHDAPEYVIGDMISPFKAARDQGADQARRPRQRLLRGDADRRLQPRREPDAVRGAAARLPSDGRSDAGGRRASPLHGPLSPAGRGGRLRASRPGCFRD